MTEENTQTQFKNTKLCLIIFFIAFILCLLPWVPSWAALIVGFAFSCFGLVPNNIPVGKITKSMLSYSIIGLGFGLTLQQANDACQNGMSLIIGSIAVTIICGMILTKFIGIEQKTGLLISSGTAICGGSAIAAVAPAINAKDEDTSIALATVFSLNAVALILFPLVGHLLNLSDLQFGLWSAVAIHDTSSVVGAAASYSEEALQIATTVKLARALFIVPVALIATIVYSKKVKAIRVPSFIIMYIIAVLICSYINYDFGSFALADVYHYIYLIAKRTLVGALFFIGCGISIKKLVSSGPKAMALGIILWAIVGTGSLLIIMHNY